MTHSTRVGLFAVLLCFGTNNARAQAIEEEDLALAYGDKSFVSIATGARVPTTRAPAVATVITAEDIKAIGATDLDEVLETVPGLHVSRSFVFNNPVYTIRGIRQTINNPQVLILVNGISVSSVFTGDRGITWGGLPLENVSRIEVVRGPGSALYGADAFSGVINIITKTAADIDGTEPGVRAGSFKTYDAWMLHGSKWGNIDIAGYLRYGTTEGADTEIKADAQTGWDELFSTDASLAPGEMNNRRRGVDGSLDLSRDNWRFRLGYKERDNVGTGTGLAQALDPEGESYSRRITSDVTYHDPAFAENWDVSLQLNYMHYEDFSDLVLFPPGAFGGAFTDGMIGNPYKWERHWGAGTSAFYTGLQDQRVRFGFGYESKDLYKVRETKNFNPDFTPIGTGSEDDVTNVTDTVPFMQPHKRTIRYVYLQDEWNFAKDWTLTAGVRHDNYSDFGNTTNPRAALVWEAAYDLTAKLLYGSAFRAPAFTELYAINNPINQGNEDLDPEKIKTWEAAIVWLPNSRLNIGMNFFYYKMSDIIRLVDFQWQNTGKQTGHGVELEAAWEAAKDWRLSGSYSFQRSIDEDSGDDAGLAPHHHANLRADWRFVRGWTVNTQLNWVGSRKRTPGDTRGDLSGYKTVDLTLRTERAQAPWTFAFSVRNLFNADASEPSPYDMSPAQPFVSIPNDIPLPGRSYWLEARLPL